jgi:hypothetical protein
MTDDEMAVAKQCRQAEEEQQPTGISGSPKNSAVGRRAADR